MKSVAQSFVMRVRGVKQADLAPLHEPHGEIAPGVWMPFKFTPTPSKRVMGGSPGLSTFVSSTSHEALLVRRVGRYQRMTNWLDQEVIQQRVELLDEIIGILTTSIETMRKKR